MARCCNDFSRTEILRRAAAEAGRGLPAIESGMPLPAGTGLDRRSFLARTAGLALAVYGGVVAPAAGVRGGHRRGDGRRAAEGARLGLPRRRRRLALDALPDGDPLYRKLRPQPRAARRRRAPVRRGHAPALAPVAGRAGAAARRGQGRGDARASATRARTSRTSPRGTTGRSARRASSCARAGSAATSTAVGSPDNPLQGLSLDWRLQPALATAKMPVASIDGPDQYGFWTRNVWGDVERPDARRDRRARRPADARRRGARSRRRRPPASRPACASSCSRSRPRTTSPASRARSPTRRADDEFPRRLARPGGDARRRPAGPRRRALARPGMYDTHDDQPQELADGLKLTADSLLAFQRDLEARGLADRVARPRLVGVRTAREGERLERHRPRRGRRRLPDRLARERDDDRRVPRAREARRAGQPARDVRLPRPLQRAARAVAGRRRRRRSSRARASSPGRK